MKKTLFVTGGLGFIGCNFVRYMKGKYPDYKQVIIDNYSLPGMETTLDGIEDITIERADIRDFEKMKELYQKYKPNYMVNFAADSHNDRAINAPNSFFETNTLGCQYLLECSRQFGIEKHVHVSTIEVYGEQGDVPYFTETSPLNAKTPYSCAKAGGDMAVRAYMNTYDMNISMTHCANNYGPYQYPEKLIPVMVTNLMLGKKIPIYGDGLQMRDWLHTIDHSRAIDLVLHKGTKGGIYDISSRQEVTNMTIAKLVLKFMGMGEEKIEHVADRPNHDRRYLIEPAKIEKELGFTASVPFEDGIRQTVEWYRNNEAWWRPIIEQNKNLQFDWSTFKK